MKRIQIQNTAGSMGNLVKTIDRLRKTRTSLGLIPTLLESRLVVLCQECTASVRREPQWPS